MTAWTEKETSDLQRLIQEGMSYTKIGEKLGISRSAVSGKVFRMKNPEQPTRPSLKKAEISWDRRVFETWGERKRRLARERGNDRT